MQEFEIYLPTKHNDGQPVDPAHIEAIERRLAEHFGGYTHLKQRSKGFWQIGGVTFLDEVTIVRVIDLDAHGPEKFDMAAFKKEIERTLQQESVLIVSREVTVM